MLQSEAPCSSRKASDSYQVEFSDGLMDGFGTYTFGAGGWYAGQVWASHLLKFPILLARILIALTSVCLCKKSAGSSEMCCHHLHQL